MSVKRGDRPGFHNHGSLSEKALAGIPATLGVAPPSIRDRPRIAIGHMFSYRASTPFCITFPGRPLRYMRSHISVLDIDERGNRLEAVATSGQKKLKGPRRE